MPHSGGGWVGWLETLYSQLLKVEVVEEPPGQEAQLVVGQVPGGGG